MITTSEFDTLTYRELADRLGLSLDAARARVRRGRWLKSMDDDGVVRVSVPLSALNKTPEQDENIPSYEGEKELEFTVDALDILRDILCGLREEIKRKDQEIIRLTSIVEKEATDDF